MKTKMSGPELIGKVCALEGFLMVLIDQYLASTPGVDVGKVVDNMTKNAIALGKDIDHPEFQASVELFARDFAERLKAAHK